MKLGQRVRFKDPDSFYADVKRKVGGGRVGVVTGFTYPGEQPILTFPAEGRKKCFRFGMTRRDYLEEVEARFFRRVGGGTEEGIDFIECMGDKAYAIAFIFGDMKRTDVSSLFPISVCETLVSRGSWEELEQAPVRREG